VFYIQQYFHACWMTQPSDTDRGLLAWYPGEAVPFQGEVKEREEKGTRIFGASPQVKEPH
jgi:hypothetical protein